MNMMGCHSLARHRKKHGLGAHVPPPHHLLHLRIGERGVRPLWAAVSPHGGAAQSEAPVPLAIRVTCDTHDLCGAPAPVTRAGAILLRGL